MAGNRQQFTLQFNADTAQAKKAIQDLNNSLKKVTEASINDFGISRELEEASNAAKELRTHIVAATNASTGKLNLNEFNASIRASESNLNSLLSKLANGGAAGQAAFMSFANAVAQSEIPLKKVNATLANMATTLKNTIKWELSSNFVHGLEGALSGAVSYAKSLNTSLTNIRIVTNQSVDDMIRFTAEANKMAKTLSTTTKAYADASLIYYQQGDNAEQAAKKAAITIKAANASFNTSAAEMSEYLTAVWNSYQVGADELERYVDIMAALGAKTATSLEEIATSMQKVAATANTVGVSMEQVSSIISTVSSVTRESAESIGTSYKTIFARMGDLKLGETLEDGIGLGQVSKQLNAIGVQILDASGNLRDMGDIITDLGNKWQTMTSAQKTATAQVVAGKRQYTQLMALFENWDMYNQNLNIASNSNGSLQNMADIYAESWEAASARVQASLESIYSSLINDQAIIKMTNFTASIVDGLSGFVKTLGGAGGVLRQFGAIAMIVFQKQISNGITQAIGSIQKFFNTKNQVSEYVTNLQNIKETLQTLKITSDQSGTTTEIDNAIQLIGLKETLAAKEANLDDLQKNAAQAAIASMSEEINMVNQLGKAYDQADQQIQELIHSMTSADIRSMDLMQGSSGMTQLAADKQALDLILENYYTTPGITEKQGAAAYDYIQNKLKVTTLSGVEKAYESAVEDTAAIDAAIKRIESLKNSANGAEAEAKELGLAMDFIGQYAQRAGGPAKTLFEELKTNMNSLPIEDLKNKLNELKQAIIFEIYGVQNYEQLRQKLADLGIIVSANASKFDLLEAAAKKAGIQFFQLDTSSKKLESGFTSLKSKIEGLGSSLNKNLNKIQSIASMMMSFSSAITSASNAAQNWEDNGLAEKIGAIGSSLSSVVSMGFAGFRIGGVLGAGIGAGLGIIGSVISAVDGYNKKIEEERLERLSKNAEQTQQQLTNLKQTKSETEALVSSYGRLWGEYEQTGTITEELITATQELATAYGLVDGAVIKTAEDLKGLHSELILTTLHENAKLAKEYETIINTGLIGVAKGESLRGKDDNLTLKLNQRAISEYEMASMSEQGLLTSEQQKFYQAGQSHIDSSMPLTGELYGLSNEYSVLYGQQYEAAPDWSQIVTVADLKEAILNDDLFGGEEAFEELIAVLEDEEIELSDNFVQNQKFYQNANGQVLLQGSSGFEYFDPFRVTTDGYGSIYQQDPSKVYGRTYYIPDAEYVTWNPTIDKRKGDFKVSESNVNRSSSLGTYNLGTQFYELLDMFGGIDNPTATKHIGAILLELFTNSDWTSYFKDYINTKDPETQVAYQNFINKLVTGGYETVAEMLGDASALGFNDTFTTNWTFDDDGRNKTLTTIANNYYNGLRESGNELIAGILGKDFNITNFMRTDEIDLFDNHGELIWDELLPQDLPKQYMAIQEASQAIVDKKATIYKYIRDNQISEDSVEYQALMDVMAELDAIDSIYQKIIGKDSVVTQTLAPIIEAQQGLEKLGVVDKILNFRLNGASPNKTLKAVNDLIDSSDPALLGITAEKGTKEYLEQRQALIESLITVYANDLSGFTTLYLNLEKILFSATGNTDLMTQYMPILLEKGIDTADKLTNNVVRAIILAASQGIGLKDSELFQGATASVELDNGITDMTAEQTKFQNAVSKRTSDQSAATDLYNLLFNPDGSARDFLTQELDLDQVFDYGTFKNMTKEDQDTYLALIDQKYTDYISGMWEAAIDAAPDAEDVENYATLYNRWSTEATGQFKLETGADGSLHVAGYADIMGHKDGSYTVGTDGSLYLNGGLVATPTAVQTGYRDTLLLEQQYQSDAANYNNAVAGSRAFDLMTPASQKTFDKLTDAEKKIMEMERAQSKVEALTNAVSEFQNSGKLSKNTKNTLEMLGINADDIDTIDELIGQIKILQETTDFDVKTASGLSDDQLKEIFNDDDTVKGFYELGDDSTITQEQYNNAVQAYKMKLAILGIDTQELKLQYEQAQAVEELTKKASKMTAAYDALSNSIGKSALSFETITKATQAGLNVSNWSSDISTQLDIISEAAYKAYEAEVKVLEVQKNDFDDRRITNVQKLKKELSNLMKETTTDNDINKFINDYFSNFNGVTQKSVRNYITSMKAAGKELSWEGNNGLIAYLRAENILTDEEIALLKAKLKDGLTGMLDKAIAEHQVAAQEIADAWITAFDAIKKAKQGLADGKSIAESLIGDTKSQAALLSQYFQNNPNATNEEATAWLQNRNLSQSAPEFTPDSWSLSNWSQARGVFSVANRNASQEGTNKEFAKTTYQWEKWVNGRLQETWDALDDEAKKTMEVEDGVTTYEEYVAKSWKEFLNGRTKKEAYWDERAAMIVAESDANQQWANSQIETAQTTYKNTVEENQTKVDAWRQIYNAQNKVLEDKTGTTTLETALDGNLQTVLDAINKGLSEEDQYTLADLKEMSVSDIAAQINDFNANIANAKITLQNALSQGTNIKGQTIDLSDTKAGEEALETASQTSAKATDANIDEETVSEDVIKSLASSVNMAKDEFKQFTAAMIEAGEVTAETTEGQYKQARSLARIQTGLKTVRDGMKNWKKELKSTEGDIQAHNKVLSEMRSSFEDILDVPTGALNDLSEEFMTSKETAELLKGAMDGDIDSYNKLQTAVAEQILIGAGATVSPDVQNAINTIAAEMDNLPINEPIEFGKLAIVSPALYDALSSYVGAIAAAGGDVQAAAAALGFDLQYTTKEVPIEAMGPEYSVGGSFTTKDGTFTTVNASLNKEAGTYTVTAVKAITNKGTHGGNIGGSSSKSSGGGGGSKPKKLDKKKPEDEKERYHYLEQQLKRLNESFTETDKLKDRTYGNKHLKNLEQEISLLKEQLDVQRDYIKAAKEYLAIDQQRVASLGATFDADGNITNYEEVMDSIIGKYNDFIDRYNSASASQQENMEEEKKEWDEWYEEKIEWISQYEETLATVNEKQNDLLETQNKISEAMLEKIQYKVEVKVDINKDEQDLLDYLSEKYDEVIEKQGVIMNNLIRESELAQDNIRTLEQSRYELELAFNSGNINQADYVEGLRDINEQLLDNLKTINDVKKDIEELYSDTIEDASKVIDKQTQKINNASEAMKSYISILQLLGKGQNYEDLMYFYEKQYDYNKASLQTQMDLLEVLKQEEKYYLDRIDSAEGLTETEREQYEALQETMQDVQKEILSSTESTLQSLQEKYNNTINSIMKNLEESIVGEGNSLSWLSEEYSYYLEEFNRYLSAQKQLYEVNKLNRNIDKSIADTTETLYRKQLKQLQDEINAKAESNSLSEYELNIMNLKYELLLKQIALEEAQNAKSTVRLTRDSEGNMIYQYTADADEISKAQQEYEDVLQQMVDANYEQIHNVEQQTIETYQNMVDKIKEIASDETLTQEQKMERIAEIVSQTKDTLRYLLEQYNITSENLMYANELVSERYNTALWEHSENAKNNMNTTIAEMIANTDKYVAEMQNACGNGGSIQSALEDYSTKVDEIAELTNTRYGDMIDAVQDYDRVTEDAEDETRKMANELRNNLLPQIHTTTNAWDTYYKTLRTSITQTEALISKNNALISSLAQITQAAQRAQSAIASVSSSRASTSSEGGNSGSSGSGSSGTGGGSNINGYSVTVQGKGQTNTFKLATSQYGSAEAARGTADAYITQLKLQHPEYKISGPTQYATGGLADYTGPAWLDGTKNKPELILNPEDTQNMFRTIDAVRQLDKTTLNIMDDFINFATSSMMANMFNLHAGSTNGSSGELQQNVQITAEFPNVQDRNEIEAAFDNLINRASQFIGSKGRP